MVESRWLDLTAASAYLSLRPDSFARKVKVGIIPEPSTQLGERTPRWDRGALDTTMSGGVGSTNARQAVNSLAAQIEAAGGKNLPHPRGRDGQRKQPVNDLLAERIQKARQAFIGAARPVTDAELAASQAAAQARAAEPKGHKPLAEGH